MTRPNQSMKSWRGVSHRTSWIVAISLLSMAIAEADESKEMARMHGARWFALRRDFIDWFGSVMEPSTIVTNRSQLSIALGRISV